ncbi:MAG TPA: methyltransferase domain-containing protein [Patescibacteria group bacterium]|nr:methyltransferase domain-containing protein [Patescibacteria group bacterium]
MNVADKYNKIYSENKVVFGVGKPEGIVEKILDFGKTGTALELGAGEGRNSLFLASHGFTVRAVDISEIGVSKIRTIAQKQNLPLEVEVADITAFIWDKNYDVIVSTFVFHHLPRAIVLNLVHQMQAHTADGGFNAVTLFKDGGDFSRHSFGQDFFYVKDDELQALYGDWEILKYFERERPAFDKNSDGTSMVNTCAYLLARKRNS